MISNYLILYGKLYIPKIQCQILNFSIYYKYLVNNKYIYIYLLQIYQIIYWSVTSEVRAKVDVLSKYIDRGYFKILTVILFRFLGYICKYILLTNIIIMIIDQ